MGIIVKLGASSTRRLQLAEDKIGTMLPCNVIVQELPDGRVEAAAVDPIASMSTVDNPCLGDIARQVQETLKNVVQSL